MLLMSRRKTINLTESKKKQKCESCRRSNSAKPKKNSMVIDKKPVVPPHGTSNIPSAPPQTMKNQNDESGVSCDIHLQLSSESGSKILDRPTCLDALLPMPSAPASEESCTEK
ncbi:hypothetical protein GCK32_021609 [Trichostrongylus colubriformis]|uniref:Uncharacterized protein n=1 Tax=Trichostrongylus colubriformis TaxID=6319 RepID=A0AAN8FMT6_TRICO